ncbi:MAG: AI-2E family transporter [Thiobacillaceae bacterium]|jgi:predicted PurR-regulated permease PerM
MREITANTLARRALLVLFLTLLGAAVLTVLAPFLIPMVWASILAYATWPLHTLLLRMLPNRASLAALLMTLLTSSAVVLPTLWVIFLVQRDAGNLADYLAAEMAAGRIKPPAFIADFPVAGKEVFAWLQALVAEPARMKAELRAHLGNLNEWAVSLVGGIGRNLIKLGLALFTLFFLYLHGRIVASQSRTVLVSLLGERANDYFDAAASTTRGVVYGIVATAVVQGVVAGLGYWVAGVPAPGTLAAVTALIALIPFGTPFIWGGASLWLLFSGKTAAATGLFLWGTFVVSWVDNIVRPLVLAGATKIPFILALFGVLGGLAAFGLVGLFLGPVILAVALAVWREWLESPEKKGA